jgi:hypothetical protein
MDKLRELSQIIDPILKEYADLPYHYGDLKHKLIVSDDLKITTKNISNRKLITNFDLDSYNLG